MTTDLHPRLPGTMEGKLEASARLYTALHDSHDLCGELLTMLEAIDRRLRAGEDVASLWFEVRETVRLGQTGREQLHAVIKHFTPKTAA